MKEKQKNVDFPTFQYKAWYAKNKLQFTHIMEFAKETGFWYFYIGTGSASLRAYGTCTSKKCCTLGVLTFGWANHNIITVLMPGEL